MSSVDLAHSESGLDIPASWSMRTQTAAAKDRARLTAEEFGWLRYLPIALFVVFLFPNTRIQPLAGTMILGRWIALFVIAGLTVGKMLTAERLFDRLSPLARMGLVCFAWLSISIPFSVSVANSAAKWVAFMVFLLFCAAYSRMMGTRVGAIQTLIPLLGLFLVIIWVTPMAIRLYPQPEQGYTGWVNGFFRFTPQLGQFLAFWGVPGTIYLLANAKTSLLKLGLLVTLCLASFLVVASGSRAGAVTVFLFLLLYVLRQPWRFRYAALAKAVVLAILTLSLLSSQDIQQDVYRFLMKYTYVGATDILDSRTSYWARTTQAFETNEWIGAGFGVQEQQTGAALGVSTASGFVEQGSSYLGILEESGILGATPMFIFLLVAAWKAGTSLLQSEDPLDLLLSQVIVAGLIWASIENFLLYMGNAASILVFFAFFMKERLPHLEGSK